MVKYDTITYVTRETYLLEQQGGVGGAEDPHWPWQMGLQWSQDLHWLLQTFLLQ